MRGRRWSDAVSGNVGWVFTESACRRYLLGDPVHRVPGRTESLAGAVHRDPRPAYGIRPPTCRLVVLGQCGPGGGRNRVEINARRWRRALSEPSRSGRMRSVSTWRMSLPVNRRTPSTYNRRCAAGRDPPATSGAAARFLRDLEAGATPLVCLTVTLAPTLPRSRHLSSIIGLEGN